MTDTQLNLSLEPPVEPPVCHWCHGDGRSLRNPDQLCPVCAGEGRAPLYDPETAEIPF